jgi:hypothetical protein
MITEQKLDNSIYHMLLDISEQFMGVSKPFITCPRIEILYDFDLFGSHASQATLPKPKCG